MKKIVILLGLMLVVGVALTGCAGKSTTSTTSSSTSEAPPAPPATDAIPQDSGT